MNPPTQKNNPKRRVKSGKILVVEDNRDQWAFIQKAIEKIMPEVEPVLATNPHEAINYLEDCLFTSVSLPQVILLDLYLPERKDGWQVLDRIRDMSAPVNQIPVVILSSSAEQEDITRSYERGINSYVVKPVTFEDWLDYFEIIKEYWWEAAALPERRSAGLL